jgi:hypothetical protein
MDVMHSGCGFQSGILGELRVELVGEFGHQLFALGIVGGEFNSSGGESRLHIVIALHQKPDMVDRGADAAFRGRSTGLLHDDKDARQPEQFESAGMSDLGPQHPDPQFLLHLRVGNHQMNVAQRHSVSVRWRKLSHQRGGRSRKDEKQAHAP